MSTDQQNPFWPAICLVCRQPFLSDGEPCCGDIVCQAVMAQQLERWFAVQEAERVLGEHWTEAKEDEGADCVGRCK